MNKKLKFAIPFAVLALTCGVAAGCSEEHTHSYTAWGHDETQHWKECPDDHEKDESTIADHVFVAGECECGATETVEVLKYGNATGQVKLHKLGEYLTDYSDVTVTIDDDDVACAIDKTTGKFTVTEAVVGKSYTLTVSKPGYVDYSATVKVKEGDDNVIGGTRGAVLEYKVFDSLAQYDTELHDHSKVNEANPSIGVNGDGTKSLNVISTDTYGDVSVTINTNNASGGTIQGIVLEFEDGTYAIFNLNTSQKDLQFRPKLFDNSTWGSVWGIKQDPEANINDPDAPDKWIEYKKVVTDADLAKFNSEAGLDLTLIRKGGTLYAFIDGRYIDKTDLPEERAGDEIKVGLFSHDAKASAVWDYEITEDVPELKSALNIDVVKPDGVEGDFTVTADTVKDLYELTDTVTLTFSAPEGYKLNELTVAGEDRYGDVANGKLVLKTNRLNCDVVATFAQIKNVDLSIAVNGKKLGTIEALKQGTEVTFEGTEYKFNVDANGKITGTEIPEGRYTLVVNGYFKKTINFVEGFEEVTLEYDLMENMTISWGWTDKANLDEQNDGKITQEINETQWVSSKDSYGSVAITATVVEGGYRQGVFIRFKGDSYANDKYAMVQKESQDKVSWNSEGNIWGKGSNLFSDVWTDYVNPLTGADKTLIKNGKYELTLVRDSNRIHVFINGKYYDTKTIGEEYMNAECYVGVYCTNTPAGAVRTFKIEDASKYLVKVNLTDGTTDTNGTLTLLPTGELKLGDPVQITVNPNEDHRLNELLVNGVNVAAQVYRGKYTFNISGDTEVKATFKETVYGSIESNVNLKNIGETAALADGTDVTVSNSEFIYDAKVLNGKISLAQVATGTYTVSTAGALNQTITVTNEEYAEDIDFVYQQFTSEPASADLSKIYEGKVTATGNGGVELLTIEKYEDVTVEATFDVPDYNSRRYGVALVFGDGKNFRVDFAVQDNGNNMLQETNWNGMMLNWDWVNFPEGYFASGTNSYTEEEIRTEFMAKGLTYKLERVGATVKLYINDVLMKTYTLTGNYAEEKAQLKFIFDSNGTDGTKGFTYTINTEAAGGDTPAGGETDPTPTE